MRISDWSSDVCSSDLRVVSVPVTVDIEDGYSDDPLAVADLARAIAEAGAVGVNIEDGGGAPALLVDKIRAIREPDGAAPLFVNARTDVYLRGMASGDEAVAMTVERLTAYRDAGADGGFVPGLASAEDAAKIVAAVPSLAINVMAMPGLASLDALAQAGVRRVSAGPEFVRHGFGTAAERAKARQEERRLGKGCDSTVSTRY